MGKGGESTLRIDEPLHFMFLVAYLITYFCCAYLLFVCFKNCRRLLRRKSHRPSRVINVAEVLNNFHSRQRLLRQMQLTVQENGVISEICDDDNNLQQNSLQESSSSLNIASATHNDCSVQTNSSRIITVTPTRGQRVYARSLNCNYSPIMQISSANNSTIVDELSQSQMSDLPPYDVSISEDDIMGEEEESPPPSYTECVLENTSRTNCCLRALDNNTIIYHHSIDNRDSGTTTTEFNIQQNPSLVKIIVIEKTREQGQE